MYYTSDENFTSVFFFNLRQNLPMLFKYPKLYTKCIMAYK